MNKKQNSETDNKVPNFLQYDVLGKRARIAFKILENSGVNFGLLRIVIFSQGAKSMQKCIKRCINEVKC